MNKTQLLPLLQELGLRPGKSLGQNFLADDNMLDFIVRTAAPKAGDCILEVGPGLGILTERLAASGAKVAAIELDKKLAEYLREKLHSPNVRIILGDACKVDLESIICELRSGESVPGWRCVANLPYSISTPFIMELVRLPRPPSDMLFMLQLETAMRLCAKPRTKEYGAVSILTQSIFDVHIVRKVPRQVFCPEPEVESALMRFTLLHPHPSHGEMLGLSSLVKTAFSHRRKLLAGTLSSAYGRDAVLETFKRLDISLSARPEELTPELLMELNRQLIVKKTTEPLRHGQGLS